MTREEVDKKYRVIKTLTYLSGPRGDSFEASIRAVRESIPELFKTTPGVNYIRMYEILKEKDIV
mgnify:CR=1 FL=1